MGVSNKTLSQLPDCTSIWTIYIVYVTSMEVASCINISEVIQLICHTDNLMDCHLYGIIPSLKVD